MKRNPKISRRKVLTSIIGTGATLSGLSEIPVSEVSKQNRNEKDNPVVGCTCCTPQSDGPLTESKTQSNISKEDSDLHEEYTILMYPGEAGHVWIHLELSDNIPDKELSYVILENTQIISQKGFDRDGELLKIDDSVDQYQVIYTKEEPLAWGGGDDWIHSTETGLALSLNSEGGRLPVSVSRDMTFPDGGENPDTYQNDVFVGSCEKISRNIKGEQVDYIRPHTALAPAAPPAEEFFKAIEAAAEMISISNPRPSVGFIVSEVAGYVAGRAVSGLVSRPSYIASHTSIPTIVHEYLHNQEQYSAIGDRWVSEGLVSFFQHRIGYKFGYSSLRPGDYGFDPLKGSTSNSIIYNKGAALYFALDLKLRELSNGDTNVTDVFQAMNNYDEHIRHEDFKTIVGQIADQNLDDWLDERIVEPHALTLPDNLEDYYEGPGAPSPNVRAHRTEIGTPNNGLIDFDYDTVKAGLEEIVLEIDIETPDLMHIGNIDVLAGESFFDLSVDANDDWTELTITIRDLEYFESLTEMSTVTFDLISDQSGGARLSVTGHVQHQDGTREQFLPATTGLRTEINEPTPKPPSVSVEKPIYVNEPTQLSVDNPDPDLRYLWDFKNDDLTEKIGVEVTHTFNATGKSQIELSAVNGNYNKEAESLSVEVTEPQGFISFRDQETSDGDSIQVDKAIFPDDKFVVVIYNGEEEVLGYSGTFAAEELINNFEIELDSTLEENQHLTARLHMMLTILRMVIKSKKTEILWKIQP